MINDRYEIDECPEMNGWVREEDLINEDAARDYLTGIMESVYKDGSLNQLESCLEELCKLFDMKYEGGERLIEKKKQGDLMQWYLGYQRATIDHMNK